MSFLPYTPSGGEDKSDDGAAGWSTVSKLPVASSSGGDKSGPAGPSGSAGGSAKGAAATGSAGAGSQAANAASTVYALQNMRAGGLLAFVLGVISLAL